MTTDTAQRRLLEALGELHRTLCKADPIVVEVGDVIDPLMGLAGGLAFSQGYAGRHDQPELARAFEAFADLVTAVRADLINAREVTP